MAKKHKEKKTQRDKAVKKTNKGKPAPSTTSALMTVDVHAQRGSVSVAPAPECRFVVRPGKNADELVVMDTVSGKPFTKFAASPCAADAVQPLLVRLHQHVGDAARPALSPVTQQYCINIKNAIQQVGIALL